MENTEHLEFHIKPNRHDLTISVPIDLFKNYGNLLRADGIAVYIALKTFANFKTGDGVFPSAKTLSETSGMSIDKVRNAIKNLMSCNLIRLVKEATHRTPAEFQIGTWLGTWVAYDNEDGTKTTLSFDVRILAEIRKAEHEKKVRAGNVPKQIVDIPEDQAPCLPSGQTKHLAYPDQAPCLPRPSTLLDEHIPYNNTHITLPNKDSVPTERAETSSTVPDFGQIHSETSEKKIVDVSFPLAQTKSKKERKPSKFTPEQRNKLTTTVISIYFPNKTTEELKGYWSRINSEVNKLPENATVEGLIRMKSMFDEWAAKKLDSPSIHNLEIHYMRAQSFSPVPKQQYPNQEYFQKRTGEENRLVNNVTTFNPFEPPKQKMMFQNGKLVPQNEKANFGKFNIREEDL